MPAKTKETSLPVYKEGLLREYIKKYIKECMDEYDKEQKDNIDESVFSIQHYIAIANIIKNAKTKFEIASESSDLFEEDNPKFMRDKFLQAAGIK